MTIVSEMMRASARERGAMRGGAKAGAWVAQAVAALILGQTLFFKFSGAEEPVYIFSTLGVEPWGRYLAAVSELVAVVLLLWPAMAPLGAVMGVGVMVGAIGAHLGPLGIEVQGDGGLLFGLAVVVLAACIVTLGLRRRQVMAMLGAAGFGRAARMAG